MLLIATSSEVLVCSDNTSYLYLTTHRSHVQLDDGRVWCSRAKCNLFHQFNCPARRIAPTPLCSCSDGTLRKERVDVCMRGWWPLMCCWRHCKQEAIYTSSGAVYTLPCLRLYPNNIFLSFWFSLKLKELILCIFRHLMGVKDLQLQPRTKLVPMTKPLCLLINRRPGLARFVSLESISVVISHLLAVFVGDQIVLRIMSK